MSCPCNAEHLTRQRNAFVHYKVELEMDGEVKIKGSRLHRASLQEDIDRLWRFFSLPYDLVEHARKQMPNHFLLLHDSGPIQRYKPHATT
jgi:hypothetical protein